MLPKVYYIPEFTSPDDRFKFQAQIEHLFQRAGFTPINYPRNYFLRMFFLSGLSRRLPGKAVIFFIHPLYSKTSKLILKMAKKKGCYPVCLVSDINALRDKSVNFDAETGYWKHLRYFIFQNESMRALVEKTYGTKTTVNLELFDLLFDEKPVPRINSQQVVFAGNTGKCPFIEDLHWVKDIQWLIYSAGVVKASPNVIHHKLDDDITDRRELKGSYGLIWEGDSIESISNFRGQYLSVVTPLKLSNYLLNGLPVITHNDAAIAPLVRGQNLGFCVDSLYEIGEKINSITEETYQQMVNNAAVFSKKISGGEYTLNAINEMLKKIREDQLS